MFSIICAHLIYKIYIHIDTLRQYFHVTIIAPDVGMDNNSSKGRYIVLQLGAANIFYHLKKI